MSMRAVGDCRIARRWRGVARGSLVFGGCVGLRAGCATVACDCVLVARPGARWLPVACAYARACARRVPSLSSTAVLC